MHILASTCQDGGNPFPVTRLPVLNSMIDHGSRHMLLLPVLHSQWSHQAYIIYRSITGFLVVQEPTCTHVHEYGLLSLLFVSFFFGSEWNNFWHTNSQVPKIGTTIIFTSLQAFNVWFQDIYVQGLKQGRNKVQYVGSGIKEVDQGSEGDWGSKG